LYYYYYNSKAWSDTRKTIIVGALDMGIQSCVYDALKDVF